MVPQKMCSPKGVGLKSAAAVTHKPGWRQKVLLVGGLDFRRSIRASILRAHGLQVDMARGLADSRFLWQRNAYDWILLDVHSQLPAEVMDFCEQLRRIAPQPRIAFFVGPPKYVSVKWPSERVTEDKGQERCGAELKAAA